MVHIHNIDCINSFYCMDKDSVKQKNRRQKEKNDKTNQM